MLNWLTRSNARRSATKAPRLGLQLETLEAREVPAVTIQINYTYDTSGFFTNNSAARAVIQQAASDIGNSISADLAAIAPSGGNTWSASFSNPVTGAATTVANTTVGANTLTVYVGAGTLSGGLIGLGTTGGVSASGTQAWVNTVQSRGWGGYSTWGGDIEFDKNQNWYFGQSAGGLASNQTDFYSVAIHELGRVLGIGTSSQWFSLSQGGSFVGANAEAVYGGPVPETATKSGWASGVTVNGVPASMDPALTTGTRVTWSALDAAALKDLGWSGSSGVAVSATTTTTTITTTTTTTTAPTLPPPTVALSNGTGAVTLFSVVNGTLYQSGQPFTPFPGYQGSIQMAAGDFNGDGTTDYAFTDGAGAVSVVEVIDGRTGGYLVPPTALFGGYTGGLYLAAGGIDHNGRDQLVVAGQNAPPIVLIYQVAGGGLQLQTGFVAFDAPTFAGGIRIAVGDLNGDGYADVVVSTASQVGAIATYSGAALAQGNPTQLFPLFFPVPGATTGFNVAVGNFEGNGHDDLAISFAGAGPGVVAIWSGAVLTANPNTPASQLPMAALFLALPGNSGARVTAVDVDGSGVDQLLVTSADPSNSLVGLFTFAQAQAGGGGSYAYPLGATSTAGGVYGADHTEPADTNTTPVSPPAKVETPNTGDAPYTVTAAPPTNKCTCAACSALAQMASSASTAPLVSAIPVA